MPSMNPKVFCAILLATSVTAEFLVHDRKPKVHIEIPQYPEASRLTYAVNSTATFTSYRTFFDDFDQFT
jgi:hypothetical protein